MIALVLLSCPMTFHDILDLSQARLLSDCLLLIHFFFILFPRQSYLTLLPKQRLKIISRYNFLICMWWLIGLDRRIIFPSEIFKFNLRFNDNMWSYYFFFLYFLHSLYFNICWLCEIISHYILLILSYIFNKNKTKS